MNWIDTAPAYGLGHSEEVVARAIRGLAEPPLVFTKCGIVWDDNDEVSVNISPRSLRAGLEASLVRLGIEAIDLYQIHWVEPENDADIETAWETLAQLKQAGKLRHIGVSNFTVAQLERCEAISPVETLQPPYSMLERAIEDELLQYCERHDLGVVAYSPMQSGLLSGRMTRERVEALPPGDARREDPNFDEPLLTRNLELVERIRALGTASGLSAGQLAIAWVLSHPAVHGAIVGFRDARQVSEILSRDLLVSSELASRIASLGQRR